MSSNLNLPPQIRGSAKANLEIRVDLLKTTIENENRVKPKFIRIKWWGQSEEDALTFSLSGPSGGFVTNYSIVSPKDRFKLYLKDAKRIYMEAIGASGQTLGFAVVDRLERIVDYGGITSDDLEVYNEKHEVIAVLRCMAMYEEICDGDDELLSISKSPHKNTTSTGRRVVTFQDIPRRLSNDEDDEDPDYDDVISEILAQNEMNEKQVTEILERSKNRSSSSAEKDLMSKNVPAPKIIQPPHHSTSVLKATETKMPSRQNELPSWNLSTDRLKFMSQVTSMSIKVRQIELRPKVISHLPTYNSSQPRRQKPSFLVKYSLPHDNEETTICASKATKNIKTVLENNLQFGSKTEHPLRFTTPVLDTWWVSTIKIQLFVRYLGQRVPLNIGEASLGLKHLLMNSKYSSGAEMKLPLYGSSSFRRHMEPHLKEEIIGDAFITFDFVLPKKLPKQTMTMMPPPPLPIKPTLEISGSSKSSQPRNAKELASQSKTSKKVDNENEADDQIILKNSKNINDNNSESAKSSSSKDLVLCMIKIDEGRKFSKHSTINQSLYLKARFFSDTEHISSPVWWNSTSINGEKGAESQPHFELHHVVPIETNLDFLEANCKQNHLVVEVWNFSEPSSNLIGVAMVPLHQLYATFSREDLLNRQLQSELPVIIVNDWLTVRDIVHGGHPIGQIRVLMAAGLGTQIYRLMTLMDSTSNNKKSTEDPISEIVSEKNQLSEKRCSSTTSKDNDDYDIIDNFSLMEDSTTVDVNKPLTIAASDWLMFKVTLWEARNLPLIQSKTGKHLPPETYATVSNGKTVFRSQVVSRSCSPKWNFHQCLSLPETYLTDARRQLIIKIYEKSADYVMGFAAVDLGILLRDSFSQIHGWYNVMDFLGRCRGQIKVEISPEISTQVLREKYHKDINPELSICTSTDIFLPENHPKTNILQEKSCESTISKNSSLKMPLLQSSTSHTTQKPLWKMPELHTFNIEHENPKVVLSTKLSELDALAEGLKGKLIKKDENVQQQQPSTTIRTEPPIVEDTVPPIPTTSNHELQEDLQRLRSCLESQLTLMQNSLGIHKGNNDTEKHHHGPLQDQNDSDLREIDPTPPLENQDLRSRMTPDGGNPSEAKNNDDNNDTSSEKC